jgi:hypothetical protein
MHTVDPKKSLDTISVYLINQRRLMADKTSDSDRGRNGALTAVIIILILLLLLLGALLAWAFMRLNSLEEEMGSNGTQQGQTDTTGTGTGVTPLAPSRGSTGGGSGSGSGSSGDDGAGTGGTPGTPGTPGGTTTISCPEPSQRVTLPTGSEVCVTIDPLPNVNL